MIHNLLYRLIPKSAIRVSKQKICVSCNLKVPRSSGYSTKRFSKAGNDTLDSNLHMKTSSEVIRKCEELIDPANLPDHDPVEILYKTKFGVVRFDDDNKAFDGREGYDGESSPKTDPTDRNQLLFGSYSPKNLDNETESRVSEATSPENISNEQSLSPIDSEYFGSLSPSEPLAYKKPITSASLDLIDDSHGYIDRAYFSSENPIKTNLLKLKTSKNDKIVQPNSKQIVLDKKIGSPDSSKLSDFEMSLLDEDEVKEYSVDNIYKTNEFTKNIENTLIEAYKLKHDQKKFHQNEIQRVENDKIIKQYSDPNIPSIQEELQKIEEKNSEKDSTSTISNSSKKRTTEDLSAESSAFQYARELRRNERQKDMVEPDGKGSLYFPKYKDIIARVPNIAGLSETEFLSLLHNCVLYNDNDIVAIDKPYNLQMHDGSSNRERSGTDTNVQQLLPMLCKLTKTAHLHHVHRLDATTTGVLLFAKTEAMADRLRGLFKSHDVIKTYLCITKQIPAYFQGTIDIPMKEVLVDGKTRMGLRTIMEDQPTKGNSKRAITKYKVLSSCFNTSLLSVHPVSGVKHQVRAHLGLALKCPVLGDHKYSLTHEIRPQRLNGDTLRRLEMKPSRVRDLPMMLHASSVFLPKFLDGRNLKISCPPPPFFLKTMKILKLNSRRNLNNEKNVETLDLGVNIVD